MTFAKFILPPFFLIIGAAFLSADHSGKSTTEPQATGCKADWTKCKDNSDMANNFDGWHRVEYRCKDAANDSAKYGTPEWPWFAFGSFYPGTNYLTGTVTVIEPKAKFQNGFGAMVHSRVECECDLKAGKVVNVIITAR